jgi:hypothetical protein
MTYTWYYNESTGFGELKNDNNQCFVFLKNEAAQFDKQYNSFGSEDEKTSFCDMTISAFPRPPIEPRRGF